MTISGPRPDEKTARPRLGQSELVTGPFAAVAGTAVASAGKTAAVAGRTAAAAAGAAAGAAATAVGVAAEAAGAAAEVAADAANKLSGKLSLPAWVLDEAAGDTLHGAGQVIPLRMEVISNTQCKFLTLLSMLGSAVALLALVWPTLIKFRQDPVIVLVAQGGQGRYFIVMLSVACFVLVGLLVVLTHFGWRLWKSRRSGRVWTQRRHRISHLAFAQLAVQTTNCICWVAINAFDLSQPCAWDEMAVVLLGWAQWTLWNTFLLLAIIQGHGGNVWRGGTLTNTPGFLIKWRQRRGAGPGAEVDEKKGDGEPDPIVLDAPMRIHTLKLLLWVPMEVFVCLLTQKLWEDMGQKLEGVDCKNAAEVELHCRPDPTMRAYIILVVVMVCLYLVVYALHMAGSFKQLEALPYQHSRLRNILFRIQARQVAFVLGVLVLTLALQLLIKLDSCWSYIFAWYGLLPMHIAASTMTIVCSWFFMPQNPDHHNQIQQVWLQEVAWTESSLPQCLEERNQQLGNSQELAQEPMFCVQTALNLLFWSGLVYTYEEEDKELQHELDFALGLYSLEGFNMLWDRAVDMKAMIGWSRGGGASDAAAARDGGCGVSKGAQGGRGGGNKSGGNGSLDGDGVRKGAQEGGGGESRSARVVIAFRGTASFENVKTDLKLWQVVHPPRRKAPVSSIWGLRVMKRTCRVHSGFYRAWTAALVVKGSRRGSRGSRQHTEGSLRAAFSVGSPPPPGRALSTEGGSVEASVLGEGAKPGSEVLSEGQQAQQQPANGQQAQQQRQQDTQQEAEGEHVMIQVGDEEADKEAPPRAVSLSPLSWLGGGTTGRGEPQRGLPYNQQLMARLEAIFEEEGIDPQATEFLLTGHSLGGAMASLAALEIKQRWPKSRLRVVTFGQPRVGNVPFALEYASLIPEHWGVVNDQDPVPRVPKSTYKRCGNRVLINTRGDLIVRPTFLEVSVLQNTGVVGDHMLEGYRAAFAAILKAQFSSKGLPRGEEGVRALCNKVDLGELLQCEGLDLASLADPDVHPATFEAAEKRRRQQESRGRGVLDMARVKRAASRAGGMLRCTCAPVTLSRSGSGEVVVLAPGALSSIPSAGGEEQAGPEPAAALLDADAAEAGGVQAAGAAGAGPGGAEGVLGKSAAALRLQSLQPRRALTKPRSLRERDLVDYDGGEEDGEGGHWRGPTAGTALAAGGGMLGRAATALRLQSMRTRG